MRRLAVAMLTVALMTGSSCRRQAVERIKLITLPVRERVEIQLDNPSATLVEEERIVPLVKGDNQVDFSWANTQIDPNTIVFRVVGPAEDGAAAGCQGALGQLSAERGRARVDGGPSDLARPACASATCWAT